MPPTQSKSTLCLCKTHGCADADRTSTITGQTLKGRYLGFTEFRAHQRDENSAKRSERNRRQSGDASVEPHCSLETGQLITSSSLSPISPTLAPPESIPGDIDTDVLPGPTADVEGHRRDEDEGSCPSNPADQCTAPTNKQENQIMRAIESCRLDFQSWQRVNIGCEELVFEDISGGDLPPHLPLRVDIMSNSHFIEYETVMFNLLDRVEKIKTGGRKECEVAKRNVSSSIEDELDRLRGLKLHAWKRINDAFDCAAPHSGPFREIDTGTKRMLCPYAVYLTDCIGSHFALIRDDVNPIILAIYVMVAVMLIISGVSESTCGFLLKGLSLVAELCLSQTGSLTDQARRLLRGIGTDSRRIIRSLKLTPDARSYVCCPKCFACYPQTSDDSYPDKCIYKKTPSSQECGRNLRKVRRIKHTEHSVPVRRFIYHEFKEWLGEILCRPGMEDMLDRDVSPNKDGTMRDIWDAPGLHNLVGADGKPFIRRDGSEGRYVFSFCMDGFNPFQLKQAGKKASIVAMYMICLNLPPEERYKLENMFLVGIIPGPHEPKKEEINHLLSPLVDDLIDSYLHGVWYCRTQNYKGGRYARCVLVPVVCDTPAARQVTGRTSATSTHFCPYCSLPHHEINNMDKNTWNRRTDVDHRSRAIEWLEAPTETERDTLYSRHGVRHSELLRLPYWSPIKHTMIDSMHLFFLILFKRHCTDIWGMDSEINDGDGTTADPVLPALLSSVDVQRAFIALRCEPFERLGAFKAQTLKVLVTSRGINVKGIKKSMLLATLREYVSDYGIASHRPAHKTEYSARIWAGLTLMMSS